MSQCVPNWDLSSRPSVHSHPTSSALHYFDAPMFEYDITELTWRNGQISQQGHGVPRLPNTHKPPSTIWDKPLDASDQAAGRASGTLESLVNQGITRYPLLKDCLDHYADVDFVPWFDDPRSDAAAASVPAAVAPTTTMDALVPSSNHSDPPGCSTRVGSCSAPATEEEEHAFPDGKRLRLARVPHADGWSGKDRSVSDTLERDLNLGAGFTATTSRGSPGNTSSCRPCVKPTATDDRDSVCHSTPKEEVEEADKKKDIVKSSVSTKRSRAAAIHNQSERKRRDKINDRMKTLQKLVPNSNKTDKASMLDEVIEYLKQLQAQVQIMKRMQMPPMMLPMAMQQHLPMPSLMPPVGLGMGMGYGMGMGLGMDHLNMMPTRPAGISPLLHPSAYFPSGACDQLTPPTAPAMMTDPYSAFLACQSQPMTMEAYGRLAAMFQQLHEHQASAGGFKN